MEKDFNIFDKAFHKDIFQNMVDEQERQSLLHTLIEMQTAQRVDREAAAAAAELCIVAVTGCESIRSELAEDSLPLVNEMLERAEKSEDAELILQKLYFGLEVYPDFVAADDRMTAEERFWRYYSENKGTKSIDVLKEDIRDALGNYRLTPEVMQALVMKMEGSGDYLGAATALGEGGISFKCIAAMELYLNNQDTMTIYEAANIACAGVELQAAADAVGQGMITRDMARKILIVAGITLAVVGLGIMIYYAGSAAALAKTAAGVADQLVTIPEVFAEFATHTVAGEPAFLLNTADSIRKYVYGPLIEAAKHKELLGGVVVALGAATVGLSRKTADLIGKFRVGFTEQGKQIREWFRLIQQAPHAREEAPAAQTGWQTAQEEIQERQTRPATVGNAQF